MVPCTYGDTLLIQQGTNGMWVGAVSMFIAIYNNVPGLLRFQHSAAQSVKRVAKQYCSGFSSSLHSWYAATIVPSDI